MNLFQIFHDRIAEILARIAASGRLPDLDAARFVVEPPKDPTLGDLATNAAMVFAKEAKEHFHNPRQLAAEIAIRAGRKRWRRAGRSRRAGFHKHQSSSLRVYRDVLRGVLRAPAPITAGFRRAGRARSRQGQCRICLRQSHRADACRARARRGVRRRARQSAGVFRLRGHARILHQRRRRAGRRARALGLPALPRGAGRDDRDTRRALSRRLSQGGGEARRRPNTAASCWTSPRANGWRPCAIWPSTR